MKILLRVFLVCAGLFLLCVFGVTACVINVDKGDWNFSTFGGNWSSKAERSETHDLEFPAAGALEVTIGSGDVSVRSSNGSKPQVVAHITAYGKNDAEASGNLERTTLEISPSDGGLRITGHVENEAADAPKPKFDLEIVVPANARLAIETGSGPIRADGDGFGDSRLESSYGNVAVAHVRGDLVAASSSGKVEVEDVHGARCEVRSGYGALTLSKIEVGDLKAKTQSGAIKAAGLRAKTLSLDSGYGALDIADIQGDLVAKSSSGQVRAENLRGGSYVLSSNYGWVHVKDALGKIQARSSSGNIELSGVEGAVVADTKYGNLRVAGKLSGLDAQTSSGSVAIAALEGSVLDGDWRAASSYGKVECDLPSDLAFDLAAKTGYGNIDLQYEIAVAAGGLKSGKELNGKVNGGGKRFEVSTSSGNITIRPRPR
jgi:DUF4097 and DUF4098 domain-containing protein YvlB